MVCYLFVGKYACFVWMFLGCCLFELVSLVFVGGYVMLYRCFFVDCLCLVLGYLVFCLFVMVVDAFGVVVVLRVFDLLI